MADADRAISVNAPAPVGRAAAGQDARKRRQILDGARRVFLGRGFDAASMNDIADEAGVSKGTLYVYFDSKEALFRELVREEKAAQFPAIFDFDSSDPDVRGTLLRVGLAFATFVTQPHVVTAKRIVVAIADRMPAMATEFFEEGPRQCAFRVAAYLDTQVAAGRLAIPDTYLAGVQFLELMQVALSTPLLFGYPQPLSEARIAAVVESGVKMFLAAYSAGTASSAESRARGSN
jgi:TetR/AcrR family transcriptional regulator of autoinduction and epiphytic fitness